MVALGALTPVVRCCSSFRCSPCGLFVCVVCPLPPLLINNLTTSDTQNNITTYPKLVSGLIGVFDELLDAAVPLCVCKLVFTLAHSRRLCADEGALCVTPNA